MFNFEINLKNSLNFKMYLLEFNKKVYFKSI